MLILPTIPYSGDEKLNDFVHNFITEAIKDRLKDVIHSYESKKDINDVYYDEDMLKYYFPENFPSDNKEKMLETMKALYSLMMSKDACVPTLLMEYVLSKILEFCIEDYEGYRDNVFNELIECGIIEDCIPAETSDEFIDDVFREHYFDYLEICAGYDKQYIDRRKKSQDKEADLPFTDNTFNKLVKAYMTLYEEECVFDEDDTEEYRIRYCKGVVNNIWHFSREWLEWCFWDSDYMYLDDMEPGELRNSFVNKYIGILPEDSKEEEYFLPDDWEHSTDFRFIKNEFEFERMTT